MAIDSAIPATLSAAHFALATLRRHRAQPRGILSPLVIPSYVFVITPWLWSAPRELAAVAAVHILWLIVAERITRPLRRAAASSARAVAAPRPTPTRSFVTAGVLAVFDEAPDIKLFRLARPEGWQFTPGQFIPVRVQIDGRPHVRCYSICSAPSATGYLEIAVRRQGLVSSTLHSILRPGSQVTVGRPAGAFTYPAGDDRPIALVAGGVGITPLLSMLRHGIATEPSRSIVLMYSARSPRDLAFAAELRLVAERHPQVRIGLTISRDSSSDSLYRRGRIDAEMIRTFVPDPGHTIFLMCGPAEMIAGLTTLLAALGVPSTQIRSERFETAAAADSLQPETVGSATAYDSSKTCRVEFAASGRSVVATGRSSLLELAEQSGVPMVSSCRSGVCQSCRTRVLSGRADCRSDMVDDEDRAAGFILPCVSWPLTDCVLDA